MKTTCTKMQLALNIICLVVFFFGIIVNSKAINYYIAPTGSDGGTGSITSPWKTINFSSAKLKPGDVLYARGGTYYKQAGLIWHSSGTSSAPITFKNYQNEVPVFDGEWGATGTEGDFLVFTNNSWIVVDGITAQHFADQYGNGTIDFHNGQGPVTNIIIQNCKFYDNGTHLAQDHHIYIAAGAKNITIRNNLFVRASGSSVQSYHNPVSSGIKVYNNVMIGGTLMKVSGRQSWGLMISDATDIQIYNNTIYGMEKSGIEFNYGSVTPGPGPYVVKNNLIINSAGAGIRVTSPYTPYFSSDYNGFYGNATDVVWGSTNYTLAQFQAATANDKFSFKADPLFVTAGSDFHLKTGSPAIDKGIATGAPSYDFSYIARPQGSGYDIGAYEFRLSTGIETNSTNENSLILYPNPFSTNFNIKISSEIIIKDAVMKIYDVCGKEVKVVSITDYETTIDRAELKSGIYFYNVINNNSTIFKGKLVVQ